MKQTDYLCPGQEHPISRPLHLARLSEFYPSCRRCAHRTDTGPLSAKLEERLHEVWNDGKEPAGFCEEGFSGNSPHDLPPALARQAAIAFGLWLQREIIDFHSTLSKEKGVCRIAVGNDAREILPEYVVAVCEGLRFAACEAFDIGPATSAAVAFAVAHFGLDGGILLGSANQRPTAICMKFWEMVQNIGPRRMPGRASFQPLEEIWKNRFDRPARRFGRQRRLSAETVYLDSLAERFHRLRPLRFVVDCTSRPWVMHVEKLLQSTACRIIPCRVLRDELPSQIRADNAHIGVRVSNDGECCTLFDEQGREYQPCSQAPPGNTLSWRLRLPEEMATNANLPSFPLPLDALTALIQILQALSRDDRPCSAMLDEAALGK
jgi:hypothetical protein